MFCSKCGIQNADGARFCSGCGAPLVSEPAKEQPVSGMRAISEVVNFLQNDLRYKGKEVNKKQKEIEMLVKGLMPNEAVKFVCIGYCLGDGSGNVMLYAFTNRRFLVLHNAGKLGTFNAVMDNKSRFTGGDSYTYDQLTGVTHSKGLLTGSISISTFNSTYSFNVDKQLVEPVYNGIMEVIHNH